MTFVKNIFTGMLFCVFCISGFSVGISNASEKAALQVSDVAAFLNVLDQVKLVDKEIQATGRHSILRPKISKMAQAGLPAHQSNIEELKKDLPEFYERLNGIATSYLHEGATHCYDSIDEWAKMGDRVMTTLYATRYDQKAMEAASKIGNMPPEIMAMAPPETKKMIADTIASFESIKNVSEHDKQVVRQFEKQLGLYLSEFNGEYAISE